MLTLYLFNYFRFEFQLDDFTVSEELKYDMH
jgi:hypothetical protein